MIELLQHVRTQFPAQRMIGVNRRINQDAAQIFAKNGAKMMRQLLFDMVMIEKIMLLFNIIKTKLYFFIRYSRKKNS